MILIINLSTKFSTLQDADILSKNMLMFLKNMLMFF